MGRYPKSSKKSKLALLAALALPLGAAVQVPAGTDLHVRLKSKVSSDSSKPKDAVEAIVIVPVMVGQQFVVPAGATVRGSVVEAHPSTKPDERAQLALQFTELDVSGQKIKLEAVPAEVDNARESVDQSGKVVGILASETIAGRLDAGIGKIAQKYSGLADVLEAAKSAVMGKPAADITYDPGVEMQIRLAKPIDLAQPAGAGPVSKLQPVAAEADLVRLVNQQPFQTVAQNPPKPSDVTNLMFIGPEDRLREAFQAAGWSSAAALSTQSKLETIKAIAEVRGYKEAPVSVLLLEDRPPDMVFEKLNNTFAQRHHLRVWRRPAAFQGQTVWVCAATHDIGIDFSERDRTFIHKIDPEIDKERAKVVNDLLLTGMVQSLALVDRPGVPKQSENATGDKLVTDGNMAVLVLKKGGH